MFDAIKGTTSSHQLITMLSMILPKNPKVIKWAKSMSKLQSSFIAGPSLYWVEDVISAHATKYFLFQKFMIKENESQRDPFLFQKSHFYALCMSGLISISLSFQLSLQMIKSRVNKNLNNASWNSTELCWISCHHLYLKAKRKNTSKLASLVYIIKPWKIGVKG